MTHYAVSIKTSTYNIDTGDTERTESPIFLLSTNLQSVTDVDHAEKMIRDWMDNFIDMIRKGDTDLYVGAGKVD